MYILHSCWKLSYNNIILVSLTILFPLEKPPSGCGLLVLTEEQEAHVDLGNVQHGMIVHEKKKICCFLSYQRGFKGSFCKKQIERRAFCVTICLFHSGKAEGAAERWLSPRYCWGFFWWLNRLFKPHLSVPCPWSAILGVLDLGLPLLLASVGKLAQQRLCWGWGRDRRKKQRWINHLRVVEKWNFSYEVIESHSKD